MSWVKIDDQFHEHPKSVKAGRDGRALFIAGLCHCAAQLTDGFIDADLLPLLAFKAGIGSARKTAALLVSVGFWDEADGGYIVHDYLEYNPSAEKVKSEREAAKERMTRNRNAKYSPELPPNGQNCSEDVRPNNGRSSEDVRLTPSPARSPSPKTKAGSEAINLAQETSLPPVDSRNQSRREFIASTLTENPHWKSYLDKRIADAEPENVERYSAKVLQGWIDGDGTPPVPPPKPRIPLEVVNVQTWQGGSAAVCIYPGDDKEAKVAAFYAQDAEEKAEMDKRMEAIHRASQERRQRELTSVSGPLAQPRNGRLPS